MPGHNGFLVCAISLTRLLLLAIANSITKTTLASAATRATGKVSLLC